MPLKAKTLSGKIVYAWNYNGEKPIYCPYCSGEMYFRDRSTGLVKRREHFAHKVKCAYYWEPETEEHEEMKYILMIWLKKFYPESSDVEIKVGKYIADVYVKFPRFYVVVEAQYSDLSDSRFLKKSLNYCWSKAYQLWVWHDRFRDKLWKQRGDVVRFELGRLVWQYIAEIAGQIVLLDPKSWKFGVYNIGERLSKLRFKLEDKVWDSVFNFKPQLDAETGFIKLVRVR